MPFSLCFFYLVCTLHMQFELGDEVSLDHAVDEVKALSLVGLHDHIVWCLGAQYIERARIFNIFFELIPG